MSSQEAVSLKYELAARRFDDEQDFLSWLPLAARLAALGDRSELELWPILAEMLVPDSEQLLLDRCEEGVWEIQEISRQMAQGENLSEDLALAVVAAQDFYCLLKLDGEILSRKVRLAIERWKELAERATLDGDAVEMLGQWLRQNPIPEDFRLVHQVRAA